MEDVGSRRRWLILLALWAASIFVMSSIPGKSLPAPAFFGIDKMVHFIVFGVLAALGVLAWRRPGPALALAIAWGILDELHQRYTPNRDSSVYDALADALGAACGAALTLWLVERRTRRREHDGDRP